MKRLTAAVFLCVLLLCGCSAGIPGGDSQDPPATAAPPVTPTEPAGSYVPQSVIELETGGAVRGYRLDMADVQAAVPMGEDLLVFSGADTTTLTRLSGDHLFATAQAVLGQYISPWDPSVQISDRGISFYSRKDNAFLLLDDQLQYAGKIHLPETPTGTPVLTRDREQVYYCTAQSVRELTVQTGISRMIRAISYPSQSVRQVLLEDSVVALALQDERGTDLCLYLSTQTGETLWEGPDTVAVTASGDSWYAMWQEGAMQVFAYNLSGTGEQMLLPEDRDAAGWYLPENGQLVTVTVLEAPMAGAVLNCYDLESGLRLSTLTLKDHTSPRYLAEDPETGVVWIIAEQGGQQLLYRWDVAAMPAGDDTVYSNPHYTLDDPDTQGLARCADYASEIGTRHGIEILVGFDAEQCQPPGYSVTVEYQVPVIWAQLTWLDNLLAVFPEGMLADAAAGTADGILRIGVVREITDETGVDAESLCYWAGGNVYIAQSPGNERECTLYRELFQVIETRLLSGSDACYDWEYLNPPDFDYSYSACLYPDAGAHLAEEDRYFTDAQAMTFPTEDRAGIFAYAMDEGNVGYFSGDAMQAKLRALCLGIREAYGLERSPERFRWEQYLEDSLACVP